MINVKTYSLQLTALSAKLFNHKLAESYAKNSLELLFVTVL